MDALVRLASYYVKANGVLNSAVLIGRENATRKHFMDNIVVIDSLTPAKVVGTSSDYDGALEEETLTTYHNGEFTLEFYGKEAYRNAYDFVGKTISQKHKDAQREFGLTVLNAKVTNNMKQVLGNDYFDRYEVGVSVQWYHTVIVNTLGITSIPIAGIWVNN